MKPFDDHDLEQLLTRHDDATPPADLADRLKAEIPDDLGGAAKPARRSAVSLRRWMPIAAALAVGLGAALFTVRLRQDLDPLAERLIDESAGSTAGSEGPRPVPTPEAQPAGTADPKATLPVNPKATSPADPTTDNEPTAEPATTVAEPPIAPSGAGDLTGRVLDREGNALPGAAVELAGEGERRMVVTDAEGRFRAPELPAGSYRLESQLEGFSSVTYPEVSVRDGGDTTLEVTLSSAVEETVTVTSEAPLLDEAARRDERQPSRPLIEQSLSEAGPGGATDRDHEELEKTVIGGAQSGRSERGAADTTPATTNAPPPPVTILSESIDIGADVAASVSPVHGGEVPKPEARSAEPITPPAPGDPATPSAQSRVAQARSQERQRRFEEPAYRRSIRPLPPPAAYDALTFRDYGTNPFVETAVDRRSTFALDVDTGSYNIVRRFLTDGRLPDPAAVRVEELINAFDYGDAPPRRGDFAVHAEAAPSPYGDGPNAYLMRFAVKARAVAPGARPPVDLIFVVDTSGSMARENRLGLVKDALDLLLGELRHDDRVGLITYSTEARIALLPTRDHAEVRACLRSLAASGSTNAAHGLDLGYRLAADYQRHGALSRVLLLSDGVANVGPTDARGILDRVAENAARGVELTTVGVGMGNYNDVLLEQLADRGDGRYAYVDDRNEARRIFVETLSGTLVTVAADAKVQVDFDPRAVARYRLIGYENREVADRDFRNDRVDAGEIGAGHVAVALYEVELTPEAARRAERRRLGDRRLATLSLRYRTVAADDGGETVELAVDLTGRAVERRFSDASPAFQLTAQVAEAGEILRRSRYAGSGDLWRVFRDTQRLAARFAGDDRVADWVALVGRAARLERSWPADD